MSMLTSIGGSAAPALTLDAWDVRRRTAQDAALAHQRMLSNRAALEAQLGPQGYARALMAAQQQARDASNAALAATAPQGMA